MIFGLFFDYGKCPAGSGWSLAKPNCRIEMPFALCIKLQSGDVKRIVTVSADSSIAETGKTDLGRVMDSREVSTSDFNQDGITEHDRPVGVKRTSGTTPPQFNVDLQYSRFSVSRNVTG